jgi:putative DNA primase/helicase
VTHEIDDEKRRAANAARKAQAIIDASHDPCNGHPYAAPKLLTLPQTVREIDLTDAVRILGYAPKGGKNQEALVGPTVLVVPIYIDSVLSTIEMIDGAGRKSFLAGGKTSGGYWSTSPLPDCDWTGDLTIVIGEGMATVLSASMATGHIGVSALSCGNLFAVGKMLRVRYPEAKLVFLADLGIGVKKSTEAARAVGGFVAVPNFGDTQ